MSNSPGYPNDSGDSPAWSDNSHHPEPSVDFAYPGDVPDPVESSRAELLRGLISFLEDGPPATTAARLEVLKVHFRLSDSSVRQAALKARCGSTTIQIAKAKLERFLRGKSRKTITG